MPGSEPTTYEWESYARCPYCGTKDTEPGEYGDGLRHDGDSTLLECYRCEKSYKVTMCVTYEFTSEVPEICAECREPTDHTQLTFKEEPRRRLCLRCFSKWSFARNKLEQCVHKADKCNGCGWQGEQRATYPDIKHWSNTYTCPQCDGKEFEVLITPIPGHPTTLKQEAGK